MKLLLTTMMFYLFMTSINATIIYNDITDVTLASGGSIDINFDGTGVAEFTIDDGGFTAVEPSIFFNTDAHFETVSAAEWDVIKGLPLNTSIGTSSGWHDAGDAYINPFWGTTMFPTGDIYIGAQFKLSGNVHYGWILVNWNAAGTFIVKSFAYEDTPNTSINAGAQGAVLVNSITVQGQGGASTITTNGGTLQMTATVLPATATNSNVTWSVADGTGSATIDAAGVLSAVTNGTVTVTATANDASGISNFTVITISNQIVLVNSVTVQGQGGVNAITTNGGTLQMTVTILPVTATNSNVTWSVADGTGSATIDAAGILSAVTNGTVTVTATANDASGISNSVVVTISGQQTTSISMINNKDLLVYPNPATDVVNIELGENFEGYTVILYSVEGKELMNVTASKATEQLDVQHINRGIYYLRVVNGTTNMTKTIIK